MVDNDQGQHCKYQHGKTDGCGCKQTFRKTCHLEDARRVVEHGIDTGELVECGYRDGQHDRLAVFPAEERLIEGMVIHIQRSLDIVDLVIHAVVVRTDTIQDSSRLILQAFC